MNIFDNKPEAFFDIIIHDTQRTPGLTGASAGYENKLFRNDDLADYLFEWLPEFALKYSELEEINSGTAIRMMKKAAKTVYTTDKYGKRGEFGELLLHALIREIFNSEPAISKIFYKSATNETVKGFDAVHIVETDEELELWLGEVKFYKSATAAIRDIALEIVDHTKNDYLKGEFLLIDNKIDNRWKHSKAVHDLISNRKSLDEVFERICIPALLTYESKCVSANTRACEDFKIKLLKEIEEIHQKFSKRNLPDIRIHLFLIPLHLKKDLISKLHSKLEGLQR